MLFPDKMLIDSLRQWLGFLNRNLLYLTNGINLVLFLLVHVLSGTNVFGLCLVCQAVTCLNRQLVDNQHFNLNDSGRKTLGLCGTGGLQ